MTAPVPESLLEQLVQTTLRLCDAVRSDKIAACQDVKTYLLDSEDHQVTSTMISALNINFTTFFKGISDPLCLEYAHLLLMR